MVAIGQLQLEIEPHGRVCFLLEPVLGVRVRQSGLNAADGCVIFHSSNCDVINLSSKLNMRERITAGEE